MIHENFNKLITEILTHLSALTLKAKEFAHISWTVEGQAPFPGLNWLSEQSCYPQFYWYHRTGAEECSAVGMVDSFNTIVDAQRFLSQHSSMSDVRLWGLNGWNAVGEGLSEEEKQQATFCFLPRLEIFRLRSSVVVSINIMGEKDRLQAIAFLQQLNLTTGDHPPLLAKIVSQEHNPCHDMA